MLKTKFIAFTLNIAIFLSFVGISNPAYAQNTKSCIEKMMPWDDMTACNKEIKAKEAKAAAAKAAVLGATTTSTNVSAPAGSLNSDLLFEMINNHRASIGLPAYQKDERICQVARDRGPELYNEIFVTGNMHAGFKARNLPYWATENMISLGSEQASFNWWMSSSLHRRAIESNVYTHSCGACYGNSCAQIFTAFQPK